MEDNGITDIVKIEVISSEDFERGAFVRLAERVADDWDGTPQTETTDYHKEIFIMNGRRYQVYIKDKSGADLIHDMLEEMRRIGVEQGKRQEKVSRMYQEFRDSFPPLTPLTTIMKKCGSKDGLTSWTEEDS